MKKRIDETNNMRKLMGLPLITEQNWVTNSDTYKSASNAVDQVGKAITSSDTYKTVSDVVKKVGSAGIKQVASLVSNYINSNIDEVKSYDLHYQLVMYFIGMRTKTLTENDISNNYVNELSKLINGLVTQEIVDATSGSFSFNYNDLSKIQKETGDKENIHFGPAIKKFISSGDVNYTIPLFAKSLINHIKLGIGQANVVDKGNHYLLSDTYDFNVIKNNPEKYKLSALPGTINVAIAKIITGNVAGGLEELLSFWQVAGYKGYKVELKIPKTFSNN